MKNIKVLALAAFALLAVASCNKDKDSATDIITKDTWVLVELKDDTDGDGDLEVVTEPCDTDDAYEFKTDGTLHVEYGNLCDPADPDQDDGTWALSNGDKNLTVTVGIFGFTGELTELTDKKMVVRFDFSDPVTGITILTETTFGR